MMAETRFQKAIKTLPGFLLEAQTVPPEATGLKVYFYSGTMFVLAANRNDPWCSELKEWHLETVLNRSGTRTDLFCIHF